MISTDPFRGNDESTTSANDAGYGMGFGRRVSAAAPEDQVRIHRQHR